MFIIELIAPLALNGFVLWRLVRGVGDILFIVELIAPLALNGFVLWRLVRGVGGTPAPWRKRVAYIGLAASCLAYATPWFAFICILALWNSQRTINGMLFLEVAAAFAAVSLVLGAMSPKNVRVPLVASALCMIYLWLSIPIGILFFIVNPRSFM